jgi:DNA-binding beta-propeller fold protein YncE
MTSQTQKLILKHETYYGAIETADQGVSGPIPETFTFNTPVGIVQDRRKDVWVCDTGNNRIVIFDQDLEVIRQILRFPGTGRSKAQKIPFLMPFHLCPHPDKDVMFVTDMGNARVVALSYDGNKAKYAYSFGYTGDGINDDNFAPLQDPNGITLVREKNGKYSVYVCDEFFHTRDDQRNRCVKFTEEGKFVEHFKTVVDHTGKRHDLLWPQGIDSDENGTLFIANTGSYEVIRCHCGGKCDRSKQDKAHHGTVLLHSFGDPRGIGSFNIMRSVNVIRDKVFVADQVLNTISVYETNGKFKTRISGIRPSWNHDELEARSLSDFAYYSMEDQALLNPYTICAGETDNLYFISEPFTSRIIKVEIPTLQGKETEARLVKAVGDRRNQTKRHGHVSQLNCVTSVIGFNGKGDAAAKSASRPELPFYAQCNPCQMWYSGLSYMATSQYHLWYDLALKQISSLGELTEQKLTLDAGNWTIKSYSERDRRFVESCQTLEGYYLPGDLAMTVYYPQKPLFGQICPGSPLVLVTNFNFSTVTIYQFNIDGKMINYGLPFGFPGSIEGCLLGPQGLAVNSCGEIFIADSLNNRISKWQLLSTGQVLFDKTFRWQEPKNKGYSFTPTDIAVDSRDRLFVTDQFNDRIRVFDRNGKGLWSYGKTGYCDELDTDFDMFMLPTSLVIDHDELIVNDLVNRALKIFKIEDDNLNYLGGTKAFKEYPQNGGIWMPFFIFAQDHRVYVPDSTFNVVNVFTY